MQLLTALGHLDNGNQFFAHLRVEETPEAALPPLLQANFPLDASAPLHLHLGHLSPEVGCPLLALRVWRGALEMSSVSSAPKTQGL